MRQFPRVPLSLLAQCYKINRVQNPNVYGLILFEFRSFLALLARTNEDGADYHLNSDSTKARYLFVIILL